MDNDGMGIPNLSVEGSIDVPIDNEPPSDTFGGLIVGFADTGQVGFPQRVRSVRQFEDKFGDTSATFSARVAEETLKNTDDLLFMRLFRDSPVMVSLASISFGGELAIEFYVDPGISVELVDDVLEVGGNSVPLSPSTNSPYYFGAGDLHPVIPNTPSLQIRRIFDSSPDKTGAQTLELNDIELKPDPISVSPWVVSETGNRLFRIKSRNSSVASFDLEPLVAGSTFSLSVNNRDGDVVEFYDDLSMEPGSDRYVGETIGNLVWEQHEDGGFVQTGQYERSSDLIWVEIAGSSAEQPHGFEPLLKTGPVDPSSNPVENDPPDAFDYQDFLDSGAGDDRPLLGFVGSDTDAWLAAATDENATAPGTSFSNGMPMRVPLQPRTYDGPTPPESNGTMGSDRNDTFGYDVENNVDPESALRWPLQTAAEDVEVVVTPDLNLSAHRPELTALQALLRNHEKLYVIDAYNPNTEPADPTLANLPVFNNEYAASYFGWLTDTDTNGFAPPSMVAFSTFAKSRGNEFTSAGVPEGVVTAGVQPWRSRTRLELDIIHNNTRFNVVRDLNSEGLALWGDKTLSSDTNLSDRRALIRMKRRIGNVLRGRLLFEAGTEDLASDAEDEVESVLEVFVSSGVIDRYEDLVASFDRNNNLGVGVRVRLNDRTEYIDLNFSITIDG